MSRRTKKRKLEDEEQNDGEQDNFFPDKAREEMETMWEIPQICHFLHLTRESLNVPQLSMYEMERMLLMPRASKQLANVMTCLLSSPITKAKLHKVPPMPYEFWTNILAYKIACWFKVYYSKHKDPAKVLDSIGVEPEFWSLFPDGFSLDGKDFEDLSFKQRVWLLKTVCDTIMHTRKAVQEDIAKQPWLCQFETVLGFDRYGARYIHFPQFLPNDFRIYRHCLDNNVLSTAKLVKSEQESEEAKSFKSNIIAVRLNKCRKGKSQYYNNNDLSNHKSNRQETASKSNDKDLNSFKCNDSAVNSFISEDTNLSSTSTCSNNNVNSNVAKRNRCRSLSKTSDESILSNARSSGYDTTTFSEKSVFDESSQMFKGFANTETDNCSIGIIKEMLNDLKSEIDEEKKANKRESNSDSELESKDNNSTTLSCKSTTNCDVTLTCEKDETKSFWDNLSSSLKTDDEKLKEIIDSGGSKLPENMYLKSLSAVDDFSDSSTITCKSDDEKLSETKNSDSTLSAIENNDRKVTFTRSFCASSSSSESLNKDVTKREHFGKTKILRSVTKAKLNNSEETETVPKRNLRKRTRLRSHYKRIQSEINANKKESKIVNAMKDEGKVLRSDKTNETIKSDIEDSDDSTNNIRYNLQNSNNPKTEERQEHFNKILSDLSVSDFHLVADSVDGLRDLISVFKTRNSETNNADSTKETSTCETKLLEKLIELLNNVESIETIAKDATRKARAKLQREWFNFKEGAGIHCQLPETQRYKRYRDLPYPHLAPKTPSRHQTRTKTRTRSRASMSRVAAIAGKRATIDETTTETVRNRRRMRYRREETSRTRNKKRSKSTNNKIKRARTRQSTKTQSNRHDEYYERGVSPRTQNSFIQITRPTRTSWKNGPTLRQSTRLPAHRQIHPLLTLLPRSDTLTTGRSRRTQIKIGFYRALAKGKINVRLPIED